MADDLETLVSQIATESTTVLKYLEDNGYYQPCFAPGGFTEFDELPEEVETSRQKLIAAAKAVHDLASGPWRYMSGLFNSYHDVTTLRWILRFNVPEAVPLRGTMPLSQVAKNCSANESHLRRILRYAVNNHLFHVSDFDEVSHTTYSAVLVTDRTLRSQAEFACEEGLPVSSELAATHQKWADRDEAHRCAFQVATQTDLTFEAYMSQPGMERRFERWQQARPNHEDERQALVEGYDWGEYKRIVDIGGSTGHTAIALARRHSHLRIVVEDYADIVECAEESLPDDCQRNVFFVDHDYLEPQPVAIASSEIYLLNGLLSKFSDDETAALILDHLLEFLQGGAKLLIVDRVLPSSGAMSLEEDKAMRHVDLERMELFNGKERTLGDWKALLRDVDSALQISDVKSLQQSSRSIIEVILKVSRD